MRRFRVVLAMLCLAASASGVTYTVTSTADSGAGSLRQAILDANANPGADTIQFNIVGSGVHTITPASSLQPITEGVTIDGYTQPGSSPNTHPVGQGLDTVLRIEIDGSAAAGPGLDVRASNVVIKGLVINRFSQFQIRGNSSFGHSNLVVEGCFISTSPDGLLGHAGSGGIDISAPSLRIGGLTPNARNLIAPTTGETVSISGDAAGVIQGNLIGTDVSGARAIGAVATDSSGLTLQSTGALVVGGTNANAPNVIAGVDFGIRLGATAT